MTIHEIKNELRNHIGKPAVINYNLGRNKHEEYRVIIKEIYNNVFLVEDHENTGVKSFSYTDVITKTIRIHYAYPE